MTFKLFSKLQQVIAKLKDKLADKLLVCNFDDSWEPWMKNRFLFVLKNYHLFDFKWRNPMRVIIYMTDTSEVSGLADRLRTMRCAYVLATENNRKFYIYHTKGFRLEDYFEPNEVDWRIKENQISFGLNRTALSFFITRFERLKSLFREYHFYKTICVVNSEEFLPEGLKNKYSDYSVSRKLFKYSPRLSEMVKRTMQDENLVENEYTAVHIRFTNFFEMVETYGRVNSTEEQRQITIKRVKATIDKIYEEADCKKIVLFSDSNYFLQLPHAEYIHVLSGTVTHIAKEKEGNSIVDKTFTDLLVMAKAKAIYSIVGEHIYGGGFAQDASFLENKPFFKVPLITKFLS